jgi:hypothetical protein
MASKQIKEKLDRKMWNGSNLFRDLWIRTFKLSLCNNRKILCLLGKWLSLVPSQHLVATHLAKLVIFWARSQNYKKRLFVSSCLSVCLFICLEQLVCYWTDFPKIWYMCIFENMSKKFNFFYNLTRTMGTLHEYLCTCVAICRWIVIRMKNVSEKFFRENQNTF